MPQNQGLEARHLWALVAVEDDSSEAVTGTYATMQEAEAAKSVLEQSEVNIRS